MSESELVASICRESFFEFVMEFWDEIVKEEFIPNWHIDVLCNELQIAVDRVILGLPRLYDLAINISPGSTKSLIVSVMLTPWTWTKMPSLRTIGGSHGAGLSVELSRLSRELVRSEKYRKCFPEVCLDPEQNAKSYFVNTEGGSRYAVGVGGSVTGRHGHLLLVDDPVDPQGAISEVELATANRWMDETLSTRKVDKDVSLTVLIMQRLHQNDCTANMLKKTEHIRHICLPAELSEHVKPKHFASFYKDGLMDPIRLSTKILKESKKKLGQYGFAGQFGQHPVPPGGGMFKTQRLIIDEPPIGANKWKCIIRSWDKAATADGGCYTAGPKIGLDYKDRLWILNCVRGQWSTDEREDMVKSTAVLDGKDVVILLEQEPGSGGKDQATASVRNLLGYRVIVQLPTGNKVYRADPFSVQVNNGNVYMVRGEWNQAFIDEMKFFPLSTYKDQIDAASAAVNYLCDGGQRVGALL